MNWEEIKKEIKKIGNIVYESENGLLLNNNIFDIIADFPRNSINLIVTSPPYNKGYWSRNRSLKSGGFKTKSRRIVYGEFDDKLDPEIYEKQQRFLIENCLELLVDDGSFFYNHIDILRDHQTIHPLYVYDYPLKQIIIWDRKSSPKIDKNYFVPINEWVFWFQKNKKARTKFDRKKALFKTNIWRLEPNKSNPHPAPFPDDLPKNCILATTDKNDIVFDPYVGSGTTIINADKLNRKWIGVELNKEFCDIIISKFKKTNNSIIINANDELF